MTVPTLAADVSKYTSTTWRPDGLGLVIIQAHPSHYGQERSLELMRTVAAAGLPWDAYIYEYLTYLDWLPAALGTLSLAAAEGLVPRKLFLDVEDVDSGKDWSAVTRIAAVVRDLALCDAWLLGHRLLPNTGIYSAAWYWRPYMANTLQFGDRQLWAAQYDNVADASVFAPFGGWSSCRVKQYAGSQPDGTDLDVLSIEEAAELATGGDVKIPADYVSKFHLKDDQDVQGLISNFEGVITTVREIAFAEGQATGADAESKLQRIKDVVNA